MEVIYLSLIGVLLSALSIILSLYYTRVRADRKGSGKSPQPQAEKGDLAEWNDLLAQAHVVAGVKFYNYETDKDRMYSDTIPGLPLEQFIKEYIYPDSQVPFQKAVSDLCSGSRDSFQIRIKTYSPGKAAEWTDVRIVAAKKDSNGHPRQLFGIWRNISAEIANEQRINELAFKIRLIEKSGKVGLWDYNVKKDMFSYPDGDSPLFMGMGCDDYINCVHPDDRHLPIDAMQAILSNKTESAQACYRIKLPGSPDFRYFDVIAIVYRRDGQGNPELITGIRLDVTTSVQEKQQLETSKTILELTFNAAKIVPWEFDLTTGEMSSSNPYSPFHSDGYTIDCYIEEAVHPDHREEFTNQVGNLKKGTKNMVDLKVLLLYNGHYEWATISGKVIDNSIPGLHKAVGTCRIITAEVEKQEELIRLREKAEESNRLKSAFLANMSHEIRTPLNAIVGFSDLLVQCSDLTEASRYGKLISRNNDLLLQLVSNILDLSKIEAGQMEFNFTSTDICEVFRTLQQNYSLKTDIEAKLTCELPEKSCITCTDKNRFTQVLSNFLNNAAKFSPQGVITIGFCRTEEGIRCYVRDTGKGIATDDLDKIFDRFVKLDSFTQGAGLGLSICSTIAERLGGKIGVSSEPGKGSEFWFIIPDKQSPEQ